LAIKKELVSPSRVQKEKKKKKKAVEGGGRIRRE